MFTGVIMKGPIGGFDRLAEPVGESSGLFGPSDASVWPGAQVGAQTWRMLSITFAPHACDGGGNSISSYPRYVERAGSTQRPL
jgi:hypothetical protein